MKASFLEQMLLIRRAEERLLSLFSTGLLNGTVHTCIGQEACSVGVMSALDLEKDIVVSNHRSHGHYLAYGGALDLLFAEIMGKSTGVCRGIGGSQHLKYRNFYSNGILAGMVPVATGMAFAEKQNKTNSVTVVFLGDGALGEGVVYEAFNFAALWKIPIFFIIEANKVAQSTPIEKSLAGSICDRPRAFGIVTEEMHADNLEEISSVTHRMVNNLRATQIPQCLVLHTYRLGPHSKGDDPRTKEELIAAHSRDVLNRMLSNSTEALRQELEEKVQNKIEKSVAFAMQSAPLTLMEFNRYMANE